MKTMTYIHVASLAVLASVGVARADQLADVKAAGKLVCGTMGTFEPFSFPDPATRDIVGYEIDLCRGIADSLGVALEVKPLAVEARIPELTQGRVDVISGALGYSEERAKQIDYSNASFVSRQMLLVKTGSGIETLDDVADKKVSAPKGSSSERFIRTLYPDANILTFQDPPAAFLALQQSKVKALVLSEIASIKFMQQVGGGLEFVKQPVAVEYWGIGLRKNEPALHEAVNAALKELETSGKAKASFDKWLGGQSPYKMERTFSLDEPAVSPVLKPKA